jgi:hypothetical protein
MPPNINGVRRFSDNNNDGQPVDGNIFFATTYESTLNEDNLCKNFNSTDNSKELNNKILTIKQYNLLNIRLYFCTGQFGTDTQSSYPGSICEGTINTENRHVTYTFFTLKNIIMYSCSTKITLRINKNAINSAINIEDFLDVIIEHYNKYKKDNRIKNNATNTSNVNITKYTTELVKHLHEQNFSFIKYDAINHTYNKKFLLMPIEERNKTSAYINESHHNN